MYISVCLEIKKDNFSSVGEMSSLSLPTNSVNPCASATQMIKEGGGSNKLTKLFLTDNPNGLKEVPSSLLLYSPTPGV